MSSIPPLIKLQLRITNEWLQYKHRKRHDYGPFVIHETSYLLPKLAMFARAFDAISDYSDQNNKAGMVFGGWLANALHNRTSLGGYPELARRLALTHQADHTWTDTSFENLPGLVRQYAPAEISQRCEYILSGADVFQALGRNEDLSDLSLAPPHKILRYSNMLHNACIDMRLMVSFGRYPPEPDEAAKWTEQAYRRGEINGKLAKMLSDLPHLAVHWSPSAQRKYWRNARAIWQTMPESFRDEPRNYMQYFRA